MIGQELNGYRILDQIGEGGMATVYRAYDTAMDRDVAIKVLPEFYAKKPHFVDRFRVEAKAVAKLEHPHILPVHGYGEEDGITYLVMRYVPGGTLTDLIRQRGALPLDIVSRILSQVGSALDYAHLRGIIHRDVKPSNILMDDNGNSYLMDFGIAKIVEAAGDLTGTGQMLGTPAYMSPEQFTSPRDLTGASDQYSLGIVAYQMVTGVVPYHAETPYAFMNMHLNEPLPLPSSKIKGLPQGIERAILKSLAKQPEGRFGSCSEFAEAFHQVGQLGLNAPQTPKPTTHADDVTIDEMQPENRKPRSSKAPVAVIIGIALIILLVVGGVLISRQINGGQITSIPAASDSTETVNNNSVEIAPSEAITDTDYSVGFVQSTDQFLSADAWAGMERVRDERGIQILSLPSSTDADYSVNFDQLIASDMDLIITETFLLGDTVEQYARANSDQDFIIIDMSMDSSLNNVLSVTYQVDEASFLAGYLAAGMTQTGIVGVFGGLEIDVVTTFMDGYAAGIAYYNEKHGINVQLIGQDIFMGHFTANGDGLTITQNLINQGADIILPVAGDAVFDVVDAVSLSEDIMVIGVDFDWCQFDASLCPYLLTSIQKNAENTTYNTILRSLDNGFVGGTYVGTLTNGGVSLAPYHDYEDSVPEELQAELESLSNQIATGQIRIDSYVP